MPGATAAVGSPDSPAGLSSHDGDYRLLGGWPVRRQLRRVFLDHVEEAPAVFAFVQGTASDIGDQAARHAQMAAAADAVSHLGDASFAAGAQTVVVGEHSGWRLGAERRDAGPHFRRLCDVWIENGETIFQGLQLHQTADGILNAGVHAWGQRSLGATARTTFATFCGRRICGDRLFRRGHSEHTGGGGLCRICRREASGVHPTPSSERSGWFCPDKHEGEPRPEATDQIRLEEFRVTFRGKWSNERRLLRCE